MEDAVLQQGDDFKRDAAALLVFHFYPRADTAEMKAIHGRVLIEHDRHDRAALFVFRQLTFEQLPRRRIDFVYGREEALKVIAASQADYENHFGHLHTQAKAKE